MGGLIRPAEPEHGDDHRDVQDGGSERRREEAVMGVQHAHGQRGEPDQEQVREHHSGQRHGEVEEGRLRSSSRAP